MYYERTWKHVVNETKQWTILCVYSFVCHYLWQNLKYIKMFKFDFHVEEIESENAFTDKSNAIDDKTR